MKKAISLDSLEIGEPVAQDIYDQSSRLLLKQDAILSRDLIKRLQINNIDTVYISVPICQDENQKQKNSVKSKHVPNAYRELYEELVFEQERIKLRGNYLKPIQNEVNILTKELCNLILKDIEISLEFYLHLKNTQQDYNYNHHHINTSILAIIMSHWLGLDKHTLNEIANIAMLHDVGEMRIPYKILNKPSYLTPDEKEIIKTHPAISFEILHKTEWINNRELYGVLTHHERLNGRGYPNGLLGSQIAIHSRVVAVASIFNSASTNRVYAKGKNLLKILLELRDRSYGELDSKVTRTTYQHLASYIQNNNKIILLKNGEKGHLIADQKNYKLLIKGENATYSLDDLSCPAIIKIS